MPMVIPRGRPSIALVARFCTCVSSLIGPVVAFGLS